MRRHLDNLTIAVISLAVVILGTAGIFMMNRLSSVEMSECDIDVPESSLTYTGSAVTPDLNVTYQGKELKPDQDYLVEYRNNTEPGKGQVILSGTGKYSGLVKKTFDITVAPVKKVSAEYVAQKDGSDSDPYIQLSWKASEVNKGYEITARRVDSDGKSSGSKKNESQDPQKQVKDTKDSAADDALRFQTKKTSFKFDQLEGGGTYEFSVRAIAGAREVRSEEAETSIKVNPLVRPVLKAVTSPGAGRIDVSWKKVPGAKEYIITETSNSDGQTQEASVSADNTSATFMGKIKGHSYTYSIRAVSEFGGEKYESPESKSKTATAATPRVGQAAGDEKGGIRGGRAGDQKGGREVCVSGWKYSSQSGAWNNWRYVARFTDPEKAIRAAEAMEAACANDHIGYDQSPGGGRGELQALAKAAGWNLSAVSTDCEVSCSPLVGTCINAAGISFHVPGGTGDSEMLNPLKATGEFEILTDSRYTTSDQYLQQGDILVSPGHHTGMVL